MPDSGQLARIFTALAAPARVQMVLLLRTRALCVQALAARLRMTPSAVSQHLRVLRAAEVVIPDKRGYYVHYELNRKTLRRWKALVDELLATD